MANPLDTNVVLRYLIEDPRSRDPRFRGVVPFFEKLERGDASAMLPPLVIFQCYFVLTSYYEVPGPEAAATLRELLSFKGLHVPERAVIRACLETLSQRSVDLVDAYLTALCAQKRLGGVYSFDKGLAKLGVTLLPVG